MRPGPEPSRKGAPLPGRRHTPRSCPHGAVTGLGHAGGAAVGPREPEAFLAPAQLLQAREIREEMHPRVSESHLQRQHLLSGCGPSWTGQCSTQLGLSTACLLDPSGARAAAWETHLLPVFPQQNTAFQPADQLRKQGSLCHAGLGLGQKGTGIGALGAPAAQQKTVSQRNIQAAGNRQESSEQAGRGLAWGESPLPRAGGRFEACTEGGAAARRRGGRARELLNKRNVKGKKHARNKRKLPAWSGSVK